MSNSVLPNRPLLRCEPQYGALVCLECNNGYPRGPIGRHLAEQHHISVKVYQPVLWQSFEHVSLAEDWEDLSRPPDGSAPIEGLEIRDGLA